VVTVTRRGKVYTVCGVVGTSLFSGKKMLTCIIHDKWEPNIFTNGAYIYFSIYLFICSLFYDAVSITKTKWRRMIG
jgi:hypothetical protein